MTRLTDRYVHAVTEKLRRILERTWPGKLRATILDASEARCCVDPAAAERAAICDLGAPERLAAEYARDRRYLIGRRPIWPGSERSWC